MNIDTGELWTNEEMQEFYATHTTNEIRELESRMVHVSGDPTLIAELSAKLAVSEDNLKRIQDEARRRAWRKLQ